MRAFFAAFLGIVTIARADPPRVVSIPLYHVLVVPGDYKLGIKASLGGSGINRLYTLDTGSSGLYAAYDRRWWGEHRRIGKIPGKQTYGGGAFSYTAEMVETSVDFGGGAKVDHVRIGAIKRVKYENLSAKESRKKWNAALHAGVPPLWGVYFGNMGSGLKLKNGMFAVIAQLPKPLSNGFVVNTKGFLLHKKPRTVIQQGTVNVGLDDAIRSRFEIKIPMTALTTIDGKPVFLPSGYRAREEQQLKATVSFSAPGIQTFSANVPAVLDSGGIGTTFEQNNPFRDDKKRNGKPNAGNGVFLPADFIEGGNGKFKVRDGVDFSAKVSGNRSWKWGFETGDRNVVNRVSVDTRTAAGINFGLEPFFYYEVMFDIERGVIGLHRIPSTPRIEVDGGRERITKSATIWLRGRATSSEGVASVEYRVNGSPRLRKVKGRAQWLIPVTLRPGFNWVRVKATSVGGATAQQQIIIRRD